MRGNRDGRVVRLGAEHGTGYWDLAEKRDAGIAWVDITRTGMSSQGPVAWFIELARRPPTTAILDSDGRALAYGLVLDVTGDGVADYVVGVDNRVPRPQDHRWWITNLATGQTEEEVDRQLWGSASDEFCEPDGQNGLVQCGDPPLSAFGFLPGDEPPDINRDLVRFYAWAVLAEAGKVVEWDYAPDSGWLRAGPEP